MENVDNFYLHPGNLFAHTRPHIVSTILGSCVSVCLWDPQLKIGGINHYILPLWNGEGLPTPKFGNVAIAKLIEKMIAFGSKKSDLQAKVFGGAAQFQSSVNVLNVGRRNIQVAVDTLKKEEIPILAKAVGGNVGVKVLYLTYEGKVKVIQIKPTPDKLDKYLHEITSCQKNAGNYF